MDLISQIVERAKANKQRIVLPEGTEERTLKAANQILTDGVADLILLGNPDEIMSLAKQWGLGNIGKATIIDPTDHPKKEEYAQLLCELRKKKGMTIEEARKLVVDPLYLGCLIIKADDADGQLAGARNTTGNVLRPALQIIMYMQFRNASQSGVILLNLPLALIGGVFALLCTTGEVSIPAIIGFISLFGIATRNGMLLISHYNTLRDEQGMGLRESILRGSLDRLNPILMTALSSALALIPLALRGGLPGNEIQSPMAKVILGGLLTSTFLNAFVIPIVYELMNRKKSDANKQ